MWIRGATRSRGISRNTRSWRITETRGTTEPKGGLVGSREQTNHGGRRETGEPASRAEGTTRRWETTRSRGNSRSRGTMRTRRTLRSKEITSITGPERTRVTLRASGITSPMKIFTKLTFLGFSLMKLTAFFPLSFLTNESVPLRMWPDFAAFGILYWNGK